MSDPKYLYHYTSQKGLIGILDIYSKKPKPEPKLWMSNILYLNDSSEFTYTLELVMSELTKHKEKLLEKKSLSELKEDEGTDGNTLRRYEYVESVLKGFLSDNDKITETYLFSLSENGDDLSQWRGYCPKEGGFSICFDFTKLSSIIKNSSIFRIEECVYNLDKQKNIISSMLDKIHSFNPLFLIYQKIVEISSYFKHNKFNSEREYRIISYGKPDKIKYREGTSMIIPYIEGNLLDKNGKLPISQIIVGPTPHKELSRVSIKNLLTSIGYEDVDVEYSDIPYRSW